MTARPDRGSVAARLRSILDASELPADTILAGDDGAQRALARVDGKVRLVVPQRALEEFEARPGQHLHELSVT